MKPYSRIFLLTALLITGCERSMLTETEGPEVASSSSAAGTSQSTELFVFQPAGDVGGGVLVPGTEFPPVNGSESVLKRKADKIQYSIKTTGLPEGAYTNWIVTINEPENCASSPCSDVDIFGNPEGIDATIFWVAGNTVGSNGKGNFRATIRVGELPDGDDQIALPGSGLLNPMGGEFHLIVKYHGPTSPDPVVRKKQLTTLTGSCDEGANAYDLGEPFGIQCFDPQAAIHQPL
ncbi:MAG: hypothetical protein AB8G77_18860 [Rhodothermales bacterium]